MFDYMIKSKKKEYVFFPFLLHHMFFIETFKLQMAVSTYLSSCRHACLDGGWAQHSSAADGDGRLI